MQRDQNCSPHHMGRCLWELYGRFSSLHLFLFLYKLTFILINITLTSHGGDTHVLNGITRSDFYIPSFVCDFFGMFFGSTLFNMKVNSFQIFSHFVGGILLSWLVTNNWNSGCAFFQ